MFIALVLELITQEQIAVGSSNLVESSVDHVTRHVWPVNNVKESKVKVTRSHNVSVASTL